MKKYLSGFLISLLILISLVLIYQKLHPQKLPSDLIEGVGRIDGDVINLNVKYPGRVEKIDIEEGKRIKKGDIVAILSFKEYEAKKEAAVASIKAKENEIKAKEIELEMIKETLPLNVKKAMEAFKAQKAVLQELEKSIESQKEMVKQDKRDYKRVKDLYEKNLIDKHSLEKASLKLKVDTDKLNSLYDKRSQIISSLNSSKNTIDQAKSSLKKAESLKFAVKALKESLRALEAKKKELDIILEESVLKSPIDGFVVEKIADKGEVLASGSVVASLMDPSSLYLKIFVDTINTGKIKIGDKAVIFLDAYPSKPIEAKVIKIAQKAEFTPKEVAVRSDRIQRVYAVYIKPLKPSPVLKLGIPAIGVVSSDGKNLPKSLEEIPEL